MIAACPSVGVLEQLLAGSLTSAEEDRLDLHLLTCATCRGWLDRRLADSVPEIANREGLKIGAVPGVNGGASPVSVGIGTGLPHASDSNPGPRNPASTLTGAQTLEVRPPPLPAVAGYDVIALIGRGASGTVYRARHHRLGRDVALKILPELTHLSETQRERFRRESEALARIRHPHVVQVFDVGETAGRPYLAMEYIEGGTLAAVADGRPQPSRAAARLLAVVARAVQAAHELGVVHRDLKPSNILLQKIDRGGASGWSGSDARGPLGGVPRVIDFGLVRSVGQEQTLTSTREILGTPSYMAPEQARGQVRELGPAADIYSLGAILYELLTGRPPFRRASPMETLLAASFDEPVPPSRLEPGVDRDLETICLKCLEKEPRLRYRSAELLADDLQRYLDGRPTLAHPPGWPGRLARWARRSPRMALLTLLAGCLTAALIVGSVWFAGRERALRTSARELARQAELSRQAAERDRQLALAARDRADANFRMAREVLERFTERLALETGVDPQERGESRLREGLESVAAEFHSEFVLRERDNPKLVVEWAGSLRRLASWKLHQTENGEARALLLEARSGLESLEEPKRQSPEARLTLALTLADLARCALLDKQETEARELIAQAIARLELLRSAFPANPVYLDSLVRIDLWKQSNRLLDESALSRMQFWEGEMLQGSDPQSLPPARRQLLVNCLHEQAELHRMSGRMDEHIESHRRVSRLQHSLLQELPNSSPVIKGCVAVDNYLAQVLSYQQRWNEALMHQEQALTVLRQGGMHLFWWDPMMLPMMERRRAELLTRVGPPAEALLAWGRALAVARGDAEILLGRLSRTEPLLALGQSQRVHQELEEIAQNSGVRGTVRVLLAVAYGRLSEFELKHAPETAPTTIQSVIRHLREALQDQRVRQQASETLTRPEFSHLRGCGEFQQLCREHAVELGTAEAAEAAESAPQ